MELRRIAHIDDEPGRLPAGRRDLVDHGLHTVRAEIDDRDPRPLVGEQVRRRPTHAARRPGDDHPPSGHRTGQCAQPGARLVPHDRYCHIDHDVDDGTANRRNFCKSFSRSGDGVPI